MTEYRGVHGCVVVVEQCSRYRFLIVLAIVVFLVFCLFGLH